MMISFVSLFQATKLRINSQLAAIFTEFNLLPATKRLHRAYFLGKCLRFQILFVTLHTQSEYNAEYDHKTLSHGIDSLADIIDTHVLS
jgi:hypothetical protein